MKWHPTIRCNQLYKDWMASDENLHSEFVSDSWICPDIASIEILHDPGLYWGGNSTGFNMVINTCEEAARINKVHRLPDYNDTDSSVCFGADDTTAMSAD